ncbi:MAG: methylated-DNA--[protein]-cysteine S-methyltransferase [Candidatus Methylacidiphilales bacterium]|nr:methylated-DNA--[protein]-cysteine S-methyltransferase [Candidatus Methylacidiphilales bacterium]
MPTRKPCQAEMDYARIEKALQFLDAHSTHPPDLKAAAEHVHLSPFHFQRLFTRWAGISPALFLQHLSREAALARLQTGQDILHTSLEIGLSGPGRLHDLIIRTDGLTPGEARRGGAGAEIRYGETGTLLGRTLLAWTARGLSVVRFLPDRAPLDHQIRDLARTWPEAGWIHDPRGAAVRAGRLFDGNHRTPLHLRGTRFQLQVWRALLDIPEGALVDYGTLARAVGRPEAARAVGTAVGANPIAVLIPCHRVIRRTGAFGGYRWGMARKQFLLAREALNPLSPRPHDRATR